MQNYSVKLQCKPKKSYFIQRAADSVDLDIEKKLTHSVSIDADIETPYNVGLIIGNSGSGKSTFAQKLFGKDVFDMEINGNKSIIDQFPQEIDYEGRSNILGSIGLNSIPEWIKPVKLLSNGERARAEAAFMMYAGKEIVVIDEWTSVVDRNIGKIMSHSIQKFARKFDRKVVLVSVHNDIIDWLSPDWVIDMNTQKYTDRRSLRRSRKERLKFEIREIGKETWSYFSKYHYLSEKLPGGKNYYFGLFIKGKQVGFQCFSNYVPHQKGTQKIYHSNRTVIDPEYQGLGLGVRLITETSKIMAKEYRIMAKFSNTAIHKSMYKDPRWKYRGFSKNIGRSQFRPSGNMDRQSGFRQMVKTYQYEFLK
ncbi:MAG: hypothetical protein GY757_30815 [bacterium]|nr:hypothetical protein [bacterium]